MPMLTTLRMRWPVWPLHWQLRSWSAETAMRSSTACTSETTSVPTTDGRQLRLSRYTQPEAEHRMLLQQLRLSLPAQPPSKISAAQARNPAKEAVAV